MLKKANAPLKPQRLLRQMTNTIPKLPGHIRQTVNVLLKLQSPLRPVANAAQK